MVDFKFRISDKKGKKYAAVLTDGRIIHFGGLRSDGSPYDQYQDRTGLRAFSEYDHNDKKRRAAYYARHGSLDNSKKYSADWFSKMFLW